MFFVIGLLEPVPVPFNVKYKFAYFTSVLHPILILLTHICFCFLPTLCIGV